jgi:hypothetical protein
MFINLIVAGCFAATLKYVLQALATQTTAESFLAFQMKVARNLSLSVNISSTTALDCDELVSLAIDKALGDGINPGVSASVREGLPAPESRSSHPIKLAMARMCSDSLCKQLLAMSKVSPGLESQAILVQCIGRTLALEVPSVAVDTSLERTLDVSLNTASARAYKVEPLMQTA